jgi:hypothetical protein
MAAVIVKRPAAPTKNTVVSLAVDQPVVGALATLAQQASQRALAKSAQLSKAQLLIARVTANRHS